MRPDLTALAASMDRLGSLRFDEWVEACTWLRDERGDCALDELLAEFDAVPATPSRAAVRQRVLQAVEFVRLTLPRA